MENVMGAPLKCDLVLCGTMFGLGCDDAELRRHRKFELSFPIRISELPKCRHGRKARVIGVYGGHGRDRRRTVKTQDYSTAQRREAMGIEWMNGTELSQAIPPAYSEFIGRAALQHMQLAKAA
jgi:DNA (cytosine-5)-methyltransferase 1